MMRSGPFLSRRALLLTLGAGIADLAGITGCYTILPSNGAGKAVFCPPRPINAADIGVPPGYCVEPVAAGLTFPSAVVMDDADRVYVVEAGYSYGEAFTAPRLL